MRRALKCSFLLYLPGGGVVLPADGSVSGAAGPQHVQGTLNPHVQENAAFHVSSGLVPAGGTSSGFDLDTTTLVPLQIMEEYDWGEFAVITSFLPGYDTFVDIVQTYTDTSYFLWNVQDVLSLEMSVGASEAKTKRVLQQVPAALLFRSKSLRNSRERSEATVSSLPAAAGLPGPAGLLLLRRGAVLVPPGSRGGPGGAGLHLDHP